VGAGWQITQLKIIHGICAKRYAGLWAVGYRWRSEKYIFRILPDAVGHSAFTLRGRMGWLCICEPAKNQAKKYDQRRYTGIHGDLVHSIINASMKAMLR
jgi:hypothetical protein